MSRTLYKIIIPEFKTHVKQSANKWKKINGQSIYTSAHYKVRHIFMDQMHKYLAAYIPFMEDFIESKPLEIHLHIYAPINYGDVKRIRGQLAWKPPKELYTPTWDLDNFAWIWIKGIQDVLQKKGIIKDDSVQFIRRVSYEFSPIDELKNRKLVITILQSAPVWVRIWNKLFNS